MYLFNYFLIRSKDALLRYCRTLHSAIPTETLASRPLRDSTDKRCHDGRRKSFSAHPFFTFPFNLPFFAELFGEFNAD